MQQVDELLNHGFVAFQMAFDATVGRVTHPSPHTQRTRPFSGPGAEENARDLARNAHAKGDLGHQTTEISGASSAFIPTTL